MEIIELWLTRDDADKLWSLLTHAIHAYEQKMKSREPTYLEQRSYAFCITTYDILQSLMHRTQPQHPLYAVVEINGHLPKEKELRSVAALPSPRSSSFRSRKEKV